MEQQEGNRSEGACLALPPSPALRACAALAQRYPPVTMQLFNPAFMSCYNALSRSFLISKP